MSLGAVKGGGEPTYVHSMEPRTVIAHGVLVASATRERGVRRVYSESTNVPSDMGSELTLSLPKRTASAELPVVSKVASMEL